MSQALAIVLVAVSAAVIAVKRMRLKKAAAVEKVAEARETEAEIENSADGKTEDTAESEQDA